MKQLLRFFSFVFRGFCSLFTLVTFLLGRVFGVKDLACNLMIPFSQAVEDFSNSYITYSIFPKKRIDGNPYMKYESSYSRRVGIVIQGPIIVKNDFTLETIKYYNWAFPGVKVILSTWKNTDSTVIQKIQNETDCTVVLNDIPAVHGKQNVELQFASSFSGMEEAVAEGCEYVLKTRADMRITGEGIFALLVEVVENNRIVSDFLSNRLVLFNAFLFQPYHFSDFFLFGKATDLRAFYNQVQCEEKEGKVAFDGTYRELFEWSGGEIAIGKRFFEKSLGSINCCIEEWWEILEKYTVCFPSTILRPLWIKYDYNHEESNMTYCHRRNVLGGTGIDNTIVTYEMWKDIKAKSFKINSRDYEFLLDQKMT